MTKTKGNVIVEEINPGDIHYEYAYGLGIKVEVLTKPVLDENNNWVWKSKSLTTGAIIDYLVSPTYSHYSSNLYDYEAYKGVKYI
jgi:hypothetical protein